MKKLEDIEVNDKKVILRCDFNVTITDGAIRSDEKIISSLKTINYLIDKNCKIIIMSHLGKIKTEEDKNNNSLKIVYERLNELLGGNVLFSENTKGPVLESMINNITPGGVLLMENTRFEDLDGKKESSNDEELSKYWASLGDVFINDAFGMTHRRHASNSGIAKHLPNAVGFLIQKEIEGLELVINPTKPFVVIMGGAKVGDKIDLINKILQKCDYLLLGGGIANTFLSINNNVGKSLVSEDSIEEVKKLLNEYPDKIIMPTDVVTEEGIKELDEIENHHSIYDLGEYTLLEYQEYIDKASTIFINGTVGLYEDENYANGTRRILQLCVNSDSKVVLGGGDALASAEFFNITDYDHISTGGGATLDYIGSGKLNCMEE